MLLLRIQEGPYLQTFLLQWYHCRHHYYHSTDMFGWVSLLLFFFWILSNMIDTLRTLRMMMMDVVDQTIPKERSISPDISIGIIISTVLVETFCYTVGGVGGPYGGGAFSSPDKVLVRV